MFHRTLGLLLLLLAALPARADYRVALLLADEGNATAPAGLQRYGFRTEQSTNLPDKDLLRRIDEWASRTPTNGTALVYFGGELTTTKIDGRTEPCLLAANDRPVPLRLVCDALSQRGGSRFNVLVTAAQRQAPLENEPPPDCILSFGGLPPLDGRGDLLAKLRDRHGELPPGYSITGSGSTAITPPERFVPGSQAGEEWVNARGMVFCWCPPGSFLAGSPPGTPGCYPDEEQREVAIEQGFWIGKYELTDSQNLRNRDRRSIATRKNHPVNMLHWDDGHGMLKRLTEEEQRTGRLPADWHYELPNEEQWEYAARAGTTSRYYFGDEMTSLPRHANFGDRSYYDSGDIFSNAAHRTLADGFVRLAPVGSFAANPWGLHDVYGNVAEWCRNKAVRGGAWVSVAENCRSAYRDYYSSRNEQVFLGYRLVIQPASPHPAP